MRKAIFPRPWYFKPLGYISDRRNYNDLMKTKLQPPILIILINRLDSCVREEKSDSKWFKKYPRKIYDKTEIRLTEVRETAILSRFWAGTRRDIHRSSCKRTFRAISLPEATIPLFSGWVSLAILGHAPCNDAPVVCLICKIESDSSLNQCYTAIRCASRAHETVEND